MHGKVIVVIGKGVAGMAATRRLLMAGVGPLLVSPENAVISRGETLSPRAMPVLEKLGWAAVVGTTEAIVSAGRYSVWGTPKLRQSEAGAEAGFHVDRARLEAAMAASLTAQSVTRHHQSVIGLEHLEAGVSVRLADGMVLRADAVIDCSGRAAISSGAQANRKRMDRLVALWMMLAVPGDVETLAATLVEAVEAGWWYSSLLPGQRLMVGLFTDSDLLPSGASRDAALFSKMIDLAPMTAERLHSLGLTEAIATTGPQVSPAASIVGSRMVEGRILRAGDAAAATDPLAANGLATALWSGVKAAEAALGLLQGEADAAVDFERSYLDGISRQLATQANLYASERRFVSAPFWARRHEAANNKGA